MHHAWKEWRYPFHHPMNATTSSPLTEKKCFIHRDREAVALCPECSRFFCRECITEHEGKVICQSCLESLTAPEAVRESPWRKEGIAWLAALGGAIVIWFCFNLLGQLLLKIPSNFHDGTF